MAESKSISTSINENQVEGILAFWQEWLKLEHWKLTIDWDDPIPDSEENEKIFARLDRPKNYDSGAITLHTKWNGWSLEEVHLSLIHELVHCMFRDAEFTLDAMDEMLHRDVDTVIMRVFEHGLEGGIERVANRIYEIAKAGNLIDL